ncbi:type II toxin-antitoxin system RelE/ParE family toxin [Thioalkalivibrio sp.]|uniref:type II toxin-antitoxin system RelE/ParE family toxin n=1 Tax=Thioalkalivibrio sp. TaxID=2093813 RepID=UPI0039760052
MSSIIWSDPAVEDLESILDFIAKDSEYYALSFVNEIIGHASKLHDFPDMGRIVPEYDRHDIRELIFQSYRIIYQIKGDEIIILTVVHGKRNLLQVYDLSTDNQG